MQLFYELNDDEARVFADLMHSELHGRKLSPTIKSWVISISVHAFLATALWITYLSFVMISEVFSTDSTKQSIESVRLIVLLSLVVAFPWVRIAAKKRILEQRKRNYNRMQPTNVHINENGIHASNYFKKGKPINANWMLHLGEISSIVPIDCVGYAVFGNQEGILIPSRAFITEETRDQFINLVERSIR